jgi:hypothetical protein
MQNMLAQARAVQLAYDGGLQPYVAVCLSCDNYLRTRKGAAFFSGVQTLQWHMNTLEEPHGVKIDKRMLYGLCVRLARTQAGKENYYMTLFSPEEQRTIRTIAQHRHDAAAAQQALLRFFRESNKNSFVVQSASIAHKMRQYRFGASLAQGRNVYKAGPCKK